MSAARVMRPDRRQLRWDMVDLEGLLPADHRARVVWSFVESLDLSELYERVKSRDGAAGRPAADPAVLLSLWLYATVEGVGSARELERLAESDAAYRWLAGGVPVNHHGLADFRVESVEALDRLLTQSVTALIGEGLISLDEIAVDGTKIRASASKESFKTGEKLLKVEAAVAERLASLRQELSSDPGASSRRGQGARERAARDVQARAKRARAALERLEAERKARAKTHAKDEAKKREPRASTSDPEARCMRFPDGAVRPAFNAQIAAAPIEGVIVSIAVTDGATTRAWRGRWSTTSLAATARRPTGSWSTRATPRARTSSRSPIMSQAQSASLRRRRATGTTSNWPAWRGASASATRSPSVSKRGGSGWRARQAKPCTLCASASSGSMQTARTTASAFLPCAGSSRRRLMRSGMRLPTISSPPDV